MFASRVLRAARCYSTRLEPSHLTNTKVYLRKTLEEAMFQGSLLHIERISLQENGLKPVDMELIATDLRQEGHDISLTYSINFSEALLMASFERVDVKFNLLGVLGYTGMYATAIGLAFAVFIAPII